MKPVDFQERTKVLALNIIRFVKTLPNDDASRIIGRQLLRSGTAVGANYRAACLARSNADFIAKMGIVQEEADESLYWMELLKESSVPNLRSVEGLRDECHQVLLMTTASIKTARSRRAS